MPAGPTIHQLDPRRHYLIYGRQSIRRRCACDVKSCALVLSCYLEMLMQVAAGTCLPPATWPIRSAPIPPGTWRETVSQSRRLRIRHRDPLPRRPWSPTLPPHTSPPAPPFPERPRPRATRSQGVPARLPKEDAASGASASESSYILTADPPLSRAQGGKNSSMSPQDT